MEALSAGIPVYATNVGGTSELVDESVGKLIPDNIEGEQLAELIDEYRELPSDLKSSFRSNAYNRYKESWNADSNAISLYERLERLVNRDGR